MYIVHSGLQNENLQLFCSKVGIIRDELLFLWILSICKLRPITHKLYIKPFGLYSVCECFAGVYTSIKSFIPIVNIAYMDETVPDACRLVDHRSSTKTSSLIICESWALFFVSSLCANLLLLFTVSVRKVSKGAKIRNRYNQVPHLTQDTNWKVTNSQLDTTNESQEVSPFPADDHKAHINRRAQRHSKFPKYECSDEI